MLYSSSGNEIINIYSTSDSLVIKKKITKICSNSSKNIGNLKNLSFEEGSELVTLEESAFRDGKYTSISLTNCKKLIYLPVWCFRDCRTLSLISFPEDGCLESIDQGAFAYIAVTNLRIPSTIALLADCTMSIGAVFHCCYSLISVTFLENSRCTRLGRLAFWLCKNLTEFVVPPLAQTLPRQIFHGCNSLTRVVILSKSIIVEENPFENIVDSIMMVYVYSSQVKNALVQSGIKKNKITILNEYSSYCKSKSSRPINVLNVIY